MNGNSCILVAGVEYLSIHEEPVLGHSKLESDPKFNVGNKLHMQIANICWIIEKAREFQKNVYFCFIDYAKDFTVWITINCGKFFKRWEYQTT